MNWNAFCNSDLLLKYCKYVEGYFMNCLALAIAILNMYNPVAACPKDGMGALRRAVVENDVIECVERAIHFKVSDRFRKDLILFLKDHGVDNACNRKFLEVFLVNKIYDEMVETVFDMYVPVSKMAKHYDSLNSEDKSKVRGTEIRVFNVLKVKYNFELDGVDKKDFVILIREHGDGSELNRKLIRQFFTCTKSKLFDQIISFMKSSGRGSNVTELRRKLQADLNIFRDCHLKNKIQTSQPCRRFPVRGRGVFRGGKKS